VVHRRSGRGRPQRQRLTAAVIGFCLAAGAGSRLHPLTRDLPKPLLAPAGRPLVDLAVEALLAAGAAGVVVNAHHGAGRLAAHLAGRPGVRLVREPVLLGTGGGLANAARLGLLGDGGDPVLVTCADHVVDPADLAALAGFLQRTGGPMVAGLLPSAEPTFGLRLAGPPPSGARPAPSAAGEAAGGPADGGAAGGALADGGLAVRDPLGPWDSAGAYALRAGALDGLRPVPSTLDATLLGPLLERGALAGLPLRGPVADAGTLHRLLAVSAGLLARRWPYDLPPGVLLTPDRRGRPAPPVFVADGATRHEAATLAGPVVLDAGGRVDAGAVVTRAVVGPGAVVGAGARLVGSVLGPGASLAPGATAVAALLPGPPPLG
jgi:mannose-1-phosphate guanylyltransferase